MRKIETDTLINQQSLSMNPSSSKNHYYIEKRDELLLYNKIKNKLIRRKTDALLRLSPEECLRFIGFFDDNYKISKKWK